jgi:hypothetical protein
MKPIGKARIATIVLGVALAGALGSAAPALAAEASISGRAIDAETELGIEGGLRERRQLRPLGRLRIQRRRRRL